MTASSLYKIMDKFEVYDGKVRLTVDGKEVEGVTLTFRSGGMDCYYVADMDIHTMTGDKAGAI